MQAVMASFMALPPTPGAVEGAGDRVVPGCDHGGHVQFLMTAIARRTTGLVRRLEFLYRGRMLARHSSPRRPPLTAPRGQAARGLPSLGRPLARRGGARRGGGGAGDHRPAGAARLPGAGRRPRGAAGSARGGAPAAARAERHAWCVLEMALADSDWRAAAFVADQLAAAATRPACWPRACSRPRRRAAAPPPTPGRAPADTTAAARNPALRPRRRRDAPGRRGDARQHRRRDGPGPRPRPAGDDTGHGPDQHD